MLRDKTVFNQSFKALLSKAIFVKLFLSLFFFALFAVVDYSYRTFVAVEFKDWFYQSQPTWETTLVSLLFFVIFLGVFLWLKFTNRQIFIVTLIYISVLIPALVLYRDEPEFGFKLLAVSLFFVFIVLSFFQLRLNLKIFRRFSPKILYYSSLALIFFVFVWLSLKFYVKFHDFGKISNLLVEQPHFRTKANSIVERLGYLFHWTVDFAIPLSIIISLRKKQWYISLTVLIIAAWLGMLLNMRFIMFVAIVAFLFALVNDYVKSSLFYSSTLLIIIVLAIILRIFFNHISLESFFVRRFLIVPEYHNIAYLKTFEHLHLHLSYSKIMFFEHNPINMLPGQYVGKYYYHRQLLNASNGFISQGFTDFGYWGGYIYSAIAAVLLWLIDLANPKDIYAGWIMIFVFLMLSSFITTLLVTHAGILLLLYFLFFD